MLAFPEMKVQGRSALAQKKIIKALRNNVEKLSELRKDGQFFDLSQKLGPVIMSNHLNNNQARLIEQKKQYRPVLSEEIFGCCKVNWKKIEEYMQYFKLSDVPPELKRAILSRVLLKDGEYGTFLRGISTFLRGISTFLRGIRLTKCQ